MKQFFTDLNLYLRFLAGFSLKRLAFIMSILANLKQAIVFLLIQKRGRYVRSFTHTTLIGVMVVSLVLAPLVTSSLRASVNAENVQVENMVIDVTNINREEMIDPYTHISQKPRSSITVYTVKAGDTLSTIADKFNISVDTIKWENNLKIDKIKPGQQLRILPVTGLAHRVKKGETIYSIAKKYKTSPQAIIDFPFNYFKDEETFSLEVGQLLIVPDGIKPQVNQPKTTRLNQAFQGVSKSARGRFLWPAAGVITQRYHWYHRAIDIANPSGPAIKAADSGKVVQAGWTRTHGGYGLYVVISHTNGYKTLYAHLRKLKVKAGDKVSKGQVIGLMGSTGRSTGTHLHFEIILKGKKLNPLGFYK